MDVVRSIEQMVTKLSPHLLENADHLSIGTANISESDARFPAAIITKQTTCFSPCVQRRGGFHGNALLRGFNQR